MLPLVLDVSRLRLLLLGGGEAALRRLQLLEEAGARDVAVFAAAPSCGACRRRRRKASAPLAVGRGVGCGAARLHCRYSGAALRGLGARRARSGRDRPHRGPAAALRCACAGGAAPRRPHHRRLDRWREPDARGSDQAISRAGSSVRNGRRASTRCRRGAARGARPAPTPQRSRNGPRNGSAARVGSTARRRRDRAAPAGGWFVRTEGGAKLASAARRRSLGREGPRPAEHGV